MEKQIKDAFNEIHAPKDLIEDTKKKMHKLNEEGLHKTKPKTFHWKAVTGIASIAACAVIFITGKQIFQNTNNDSATPKQEVVDLTEGENAFLGTDNDSMEGFEFEGTKELSEWYQVLEDIKVNNEERIILDGNYVIFTTTYPKGEQEYRLDLLVESGELYWENDQLILQGDFKAEVYDGDEKISESGLNISSSSQFTSNDCMLDMEDVNQDGLMDFLLETSAYKEEPGLASEWWYTLDEFNNVMKCEDK